MAKVSPAEESLQILKIREKLLEESRKEKLRFSEFLPKREINQQIPLQKITIASSSSTVEKIRKRIEKVVFSATSQKL